MILQHCGQKLSAAKHKLKLATAPYFCCCTTLQKQTGVPNYQTTWLLLYKLRKLITFRNSKKVSNMQIISVHRAEQ